jgi:hypothetical protein
MFSSSAIPVAFPATLHVHVTAAGALLLLALVSVDAVPVVQLQGEA